MRFFVLSLFLCVFLYNCNDGDIITVDLEFGETFEACGELVFYKTKSDPAESLSLQITNPTVTLDDLIEVTIENNIATLVETSVTYSINGSSNTFNYRTYNTEPIAFFCEDVPPSDIQITSDQPSTTGDAVFTITLNEDDNDGIPAEEEDLNGNGDLTDDDSDADGIPNYLDADDDGDNVLTKNEIEDDPNQDGDDNPLTEPLDTDEDGIADYLDTDDDNDGIDTIDEENELNDSNPYNDTSDLDNPALPDFRNNMITFSIPATEFRVHEIEQEFIIILSVQGIQIETLTDTEILFGTLMDSNGNNITNSIRPITPEFTE